MSVCLSVHLWHVIIVSYWLILKNFSPQGETVSPDFPIHDYVGCISETIQERAML